MEKRTQNRDDRLQSWRALMQERGLLDDYVEKTTASPRIKRVEILPGRITAAVSDDQLGVCNVSIEMPTWGDEQWASVIESLSRQALFVAQMLAGELPNELDATLSAEGLDLLPATHETVTVSCSCCGSADASCPHIEAVLRNAVDLLAEDPWLFFLLRGRDRRQVLRFLRRKRGENGVPGNANQTRRITRPNNNPIFGDRHAVPHLDADGHPLTEELDHFWGSARLQEQFRPQLIPPVADLVLLRRLGPPAFSHANIEVYDALSAIYRRVGEGALALAYAEDPLPDAGESEPPDQ